jgi:hypothetical protein
MHADACLDRTHPPWLHRRQEILELTQPQEFVNVAQPLCHVISQCVISPHFQVRRAFATISDAVRVPSLLQWGYSCNTNMYY